MKTWFVSLALLFSVQFLAAQSPVQIAEQFDEIAGIFTHDNDTTYVVNFWATWCKPCMEEMPYFEKLHDRPEGEKLKVVLISLDFPNQIETKVLPYLEKAQLRSEVIVLTDGKYNDWMPLVDEQWDGAIPITLIYRADKREFMYGAFDDYAELEVLVEQFLAP